MVQKPMIELLAPAGNVEAFMGGISAGADAVYLGGSRFGARAYADNFTEEELIWCIKYAHLLGKRVYLTVNTLVKESEFSELYGFLIPYYEAGLDGVIVQDIGVLDYIKNLFPQLELHASTQMTITGVYGAEIVKKMGVCRIVPARELSLAEIKEIKDETGLEIESFIHGAMCYCYSGQCLFSSILGGRSGNRGRCAQPCRLPYEVTINNHHSKNCYPLSLKDMCTIEHLPELIEAGIYSFKIEGRMKKPEYAAGVTAIYRKYIDEYLENREAYRLGDKRWSVSGKDIDRLSKIYIRSEIQTGYYFKHNGSEMVTADSPAYSGSDEALLKNIKDKYITDVRKLKIDCEAKIIIGEKACIQFSYNDNVVSAVGEIVEKATKQPVTKDNIIKQISKLGDTAFEINNIDIVLGKDCFVPVGKLNELRRSTVKALEKAIIENNGFSFTRECPDISNPDDTCESVKDRTKLSGNNVSVRTLEQLRAVLHNNFFSRIYIDFDLIYENGAEAGAVIVKLCESGSKIAVSLPQIIRQRDKKYIEGLKEYLYNNANIISGVLVRNLEGLGVLDSFNYKGNIYADAGLYMWNNRTVNVWKGRISSFCMPYELNFQEQLQLTGISGCEKIVYGRIPMMITANCVAKTTDKCHVNQVTSAVITDRYKKDFPVLLNCIHCMNIIYNSVPLSLHKNIDKIIQSFVPRIDFTIENYSETERILSFWQNALSGNCKKIEPPFTEYTTGHDKRGVE